MDEIPQPVPHDLVVSSFQPEDLEDLVLLNSRAFQFHPEQGALTIDDFKTRISTQWFDATGLIVARDSQETMVGFIWTKIDQDIGEIYVVAVDPDYHGLGIGRVLLNEGFIHLGNMGVATVRLWVESDNTSAIVLYQRSGFTAARHDVRYRMKETGT
jgi:mycothiol synthase